MLEERDNGGYGLRLTCRSHICKATHGCISEDVAGEGNNVKLLACQSPSRQSIPTTMASFSSLISENIASKAGGRWKSCKFICNPSSGWLDGRPFTIGKHCAIRMLDGSLHAYLLIEDWHPHPVQSSLFQSTSKGILRVVWQVEIVSSVKVLHTKPGKFVWQRLENMGELVKWIHLDGVKLLE